MVILKSWSILGIAPTDDLSLIRKAYARLLKIHHPEDDPEGYQRLREAYDMAIKLAKERQRLAEAAEDVEADEADEADDSDDLDELDDYEAGDIPLDLGGDIHDDGACEDWEEDDTLQFPLIPPWGEQHTVPVMQEKSMSEIAEEFMEQVESLYMELASRLNAHLWAELLNSDAVWRVEYQNMLSDRLLYYLNKHYFLPGEIWALLEATFHWKERARLDEEYFVKQYPKVYTYAIKKSLESRLGYAAILKAGVGEYEEYEEYFRCREAFVLAWRRQKMKQEAGQALEAATKIFADDPDLLRLQIEFCCDNNDFEQGLAVYDHYIRQASEDIGAYLLRSRLLMGLNRFPDALEQLEQVFAAEPDHIEALSLAGQCYMRLYQLKSARDVYSRILELNGEDAEAVVNLAKIHEYCKRSLPRMQRSERREAKRELKTEMAKARPAAGKRFKVAVLSLIGYKWVTLFFLVLFHIIIASSWHKHMGMSMGYYLQQQFYGDALLPAIPVRIYIYAVILGLYYFSLFKELRRVGRYLRYR